MKLNENSIVGDFKELIKLPKYAKERDRMRAIIIRRQGKTYQYIADKIGRSYSYVKEWNDRFKAEGPLGLLDREPELKRFFADELTEKKFRLRILAGPQEKDESSTWKRSDIQKILFEEYGIERSLATISNLMRKFKITYQIPRPTHPNKNKEAGQVWLNEDLPFLQTCQKIFLRQRNYVLVPRRN